MHQLLTISPLDGRYAEQTKELTEYFSEYALIKYRLMLEIEYLIFLNKYTKIFKAFTVEQTKDLKNIYLNFSIDDAEQIKDTEKETNHDVKAIEYFLRTKINNLDLSTVSPFIHFALTTEDINNLAYHLMWQDAVQKIYLPNTEKLIAELKKLSKKYSDTSLLSLTHGQPATPTTLGKELNVFASRLERQTTQLKKHKLQGKLNGATGTFGAHHLAYPEMDWLDFSQKFITHLNLEPNLLTTQVESNDSLVESYQNIFRINSILTDFCRDLWLYISRGIFLQENKTGEIGSSTMPHKINPIQFENAEGNLGLANSAFNHLASVLPISRMQRDLSNSTVTRNQGVPLAHSILAVKQILNGLNRLTINQTKIDQELNEHWEVLTEAIQTVLRKFGETQAYEKIKLLSRGSKFNQNNLHKIIEETNLPREEKNKLLKLTPSSYLGLAKKLAEL